MYVHVWVFTVAMRIWGARAAEFALALQVLLTAAPANPAIISGFKPVGAAGYTGSHCMAVYLLDVLTPASWRDHLFVSPSDPLPSPQ